MKRVMDTITVETRDELQELLEDLEKIPSEEQSDATKSLVHLLTCLDYEW